jgi:hypothetical protein
MKRGLLIAAGALLSLGAGLAASAQPSSYVVTVPFSFHVGKQELPAGTYYVDSKRSSIESTLSVEWIRRAGEVGVPLKAVSDLEAKDKTAEPKLVFHQYNGAYFLSQIWGTEGHGKQLAVSPQETEMAMKKAPKDLAITSASR